MVEVEWSSQASQDLESIVGFIAKDSLQYARLFIADIFRALDRIAAFPNSGRVVPESGNPAIREVIMGSYRVMFRVGKEKIGLITIHHGARLLDPDKLK